MSNPGESKPRRVYVFLFIALTILPACGGSSGGSSGGGGGGPPVIAPLIVFDSVVPATFSPPGKATVSFTLSGGNSTGTSLGIFIPTGAANTLQFLGHIDTGRTLPGSYAHDWDGYTLFIEDAIKSVGLPVYLIQSSATTSALYSVLVQRQPMKVNGMGVTTGVENPHDVFLVFEIDYINGAWALDHVEDLAGNTLQFAQSGPVPGSPGWVYASERIWVYDVFLDTVGNTESSTINLNSFDWDDATLSLDSTPGAYELELHAFNSAGDSYSSRRTVTIP